MWQDIAVACCLVLILEGILPFLNPKAWQNMVQQIALLPARHIRIMGLASMLLGVIFLQVLN